MHSKTKDTLTKASKASNLMARILRGPIEELDFEELCRASSVLQVMGKAIKSRRKTLSSAIADRYRDGRTDGVQFAPSDSGKSHIPQIPDIDCSIRESGGGKKVSKSAVEELTEEKGFEEETLLEPEGRKLDTSALEEILDAYDVSERDREKLYKPASYRVKEDAIDALHGIGQISDEEYEKCFDEVPVDYRVQCAFDRDTKKRLQSELEGRCDE